VPAYSIQTVAFIMNLLSFAGRPFLRLSAGGNKPFIRSHISSVNFCLLIVELYHIFTTLETFFKHSLEKRDMLWLRILSQDDQFVVESPILAMSFMKISLEKIMYGINSEIPDKERLVTVDDMSDILVICDKKDLDFISVQMFFKDGAKSGVAIYNAPRKRDRLSSKKEMAQI
jgi:hypothetical protein